MSCMVLFLPDNVTVPAETGEPLLRVAVRAKAFIPTGCVIGSCGACEVELEGDNIRACITAIPADRSHLTINLLVDPTW